MFLKYPDETLKKLQNAELEILRDFQCVCDEENIRYFAIAGTLLGAFRHSGFIPWDDDIDLGMLREDFDRFLKVFDERLGNKYELWCPDRNTGYYSFIPKISRKNTMFQTEEARRSGMSDMGIFIEIFVFENIDPDQEVIAKQRKKVDIIRGLYSVCKTPDQYTAGTAPVRAIKRIVKYMIRKYGSVIRMDQKHLNRRFLKQTVKGSETGWVSHWGDYSTVRNLIRKDEIFPITEHGFEDGTICVPHNYDQILRQMYGNYMELPEEKDRWNAAPLQIVFFDGECVDLTRCQRDEEDKKPSV